MKFAPGVDDVLNRHKQDAGQRAKGHTANSNWPPLDRSLVSDDRPPAPALDRGALPPSWREWIEATAQDCGAPADYVAANLIGVASSVIGNVRRVSPWEGWVEQPHLWIATVGHPSSGKTPALAPFRTACVKIEHLLQPAHDDAMVAFATRREAAAAAAAIWKAEVKAAAQQGEPAPKMPLDAIAPDQPIPPRLLIADASTEQAQALLAGNPRGLVLVRSELPAWLGQFDRYGGAGSDRGFHLECWDGGPHSVDRVKFEGKVLRVPFASLAIVGSIQPDKLGEVLDGVDDGLVARFLYVYPDPIPPRPRQLNGADDRAATLLHAFIRLRALDWDHDHAGNPIPLLLRLDAGSLELLQTTRDEIHKATRTGRGTLSTWLGKNAGRLLRLALVFEMLEWSLNNDPQPEIISAAAVQRAAAYLKYATAMTERVLGDLARTEAQRDAAEVARFILDTHPTTINERKLYQSRGMHRLRDPVCRNAAFAELDAGGWVRKNASLTTGRPAGDWQVNPATRA